uniref:Phospholipase A2 n=1 Tax=Nothobranchius furzeri TaxID=105023 RepID=A0A8C6NPP5_NOTFU
MSDVKLQLGTIQQRFTSPSSSAGVAGRARHRRNLVQLAEMISCVQPGVSPLRYNNYGCWCGLGGSGKPVDGVDKCCKTHDQCYSTSRSVPECSSIVDSPYTIVYDYTCSNKQVECSDTNNKCQAAVCKCDKAVAQCFARNPYHPKNKDLDKSHCVD